MSDVVDRLLQAHGFELCRSKKHKVYRRDDGATFVRTKTPSDFRDERNTLSDLCQLIGVKKAEALESLRRKRKVAREQGLEMGTLIPAAAAPAAAPALLVAPPVPPASSAAEPSREDRRLAKRLARIERNEKLKQEQFETKWRQFRKVTSVWLVYTNEFVFIREDAPSTLKAMEDVIDKLEETSPEDEDNLAQNSLAHGKLMAVPWIIAHLVNQTEDKFIFVFEDGSAVQGKLPNFPPRRLTALTRGGL